jgi:hypothetical protein
VGNGRIYKPEDKFSMISNEVLRDQSLRYGAKGLYSTMYSYLTMSNFTLYKSYLAKNCPEGKKAFESIWSELKESGYLIMHKLQDEKGAFYYEYELLSEKVHAPKKEVLDNAGVEKGGTGKGGSINKTLGNKTLSNKTIHTQGKSKSLCVEVQKILGEKIGEKKIQELINSKGADAVNQYLSNWDKYRHHANSTQASYFIYAVQNELPIPQAKKSNTYQPILDQREYTEGELENYYTDVTQ